MGRHVAVIVHHIAKAIQQPGATRDRDGLRHRSIAVIVPGINKADVWLRCSLLHQTTPCGVYKPVA